MDRDEYLVLLLENILQELRLANGRPRSGSDEYYQLIAGELPWHLPLYRLRAMRSGVAIPRDLDRETEEALRLGLMLPEDLKAPADTPSLAD